MIDLTWTRYVVATWVNWFAFLAFWFPGSWRLFGRRVRVLTAGLGLKDLLLVLLCGWAAFTSVLPAVMPSVEGLLGQADNHLGASSWGMTLYSTLRIFDYGGLKSPWECEFLDADCISENASWWVNETLCLVSARPCSTIRAADYRFMVLEPRWVAALLYLEAAVLVWISWMVWAAATAALIAGSLVVKLLWAVEAPLPEDFDFGEVLPGVRLVRRGNFDEVVRFIKVVGSKKIIAIPVTDVGPEVINAAKYVGPEAFVPGSTIHPVPELPSHVAVVTVAGDDIGQFTRIGDTWQACLHVYLRLLRVPPGDVRISGRRGSVGTEILGKPADWKILLVSKDADWISFRPDLSVFAVLGMTSLKLAKDTTDVVPVSCYARVEGAAQMSRGTLHAIPNSLFNQHMCSTKGGFSGAILLNSHGHGVAGHIGGSKDEEGRVYNKCLRLSVLRLFSQAHHPETIPPPVDGEEQRDPDELRADMEAKRRMDAEEAARTQFYILRGSARGALFGQVEEGTAWGDADDADQLDAGNSWKEFGNEYERGD
jgi:hypothetical protein